MEVLSRWRIGAPRWGLVVPASRGLSVLYWVSICSCLLVPFAQPEGVDDTVTYLLTLMWGADR